jgi:hypothetical protein
MGVPAGAPRWGVRLDAAEYERNRLSLDEAAQFSEHGFFIVEDALSPAQCARMAAELTAMHARKVVEGWHPDEDVRQAVFSRANRLQESEDVIGLLTHPKVFPKMVDIMGSNIYCWHAFAPCTRAAPASTVVPARGEVPRFGFHRDGGFEAYFAERPAPRVTAKAIFYLTDCATEGAPPARRALAHPRPTAAPLTRARGRGRRGPDLGGAGVAPDGLARGRHARGCRP